MQNSQKYLFPLTNTHSPSDLMDPHRHTHGSWDFLSVWVLTNFSGTLVKALFKSEDLVQLPTLYCPYFAHITEIYLPYPKIPLALLPSPLPSLWGPLSLLMMNNFPTDFSIWLIHAVMVARTHPSPHTNPDTHTHSHLVKATKSHTHTHTHRGTYFLYMSSYNILPICLHLHSSLEHTVT